MTTIRSGQPLTTEGGIVWRFLLLHCIIHRRMFFKSENREIWKTKNGVFLNGTLRCVSLIIYHLKNDFKRKFISVTIVKEEN